MKSAEIIKLQVKDLKKEERFIYKNDIYKVVEEWNDKIMTATKAGKPNSKIITFSSPSEELHKSILYIDGEQVMPSK